MCLYPRRMKNKRYVATKKNGGNIPLLVDKRMEYIDVPCNKCRPCRRKKANGWRIRLIEELKYNNRKAVMVTLTYSHEGYTKLANSCSKAFEGYALDNEIARKSIKKFREDYKRKTGEKMEYFLVTELGHGEFEHLHFHGIMFTSFVEELNDIWGHGNVWDSVRGKDKQGNDGYVNLRTVNYIVKYVSKVDLVHEYYEPKTFVSDGIGKGYLDSAKVQRNRRGFDEYVAENWDKYPLPTYYRNKIWNDEERIELWRKSLDRKVYFLDGTKIDFNYEGGEDRFNQILKQKRIDNKFFKYGDDKFDFWEWRKENERRNEKIKERFTKSFDLGQKG